MAFSATFVYQIVSAKYLADMAKMRTASRQFRQDLFTSSKSLTDFGSRATKASTALANLRTGFAAMMLTRGIKDVTKEALDFSTAMFKVEAWTSASKDQMRMLRQEAMKLNRETKFTAINVAESMGLLGKRGLSPSIIKELAPVIAGLATAGGDTTMAEVTQALGDALTIYGEGTEQAVKYADMMATASAGAAFDMLQLVDAFGRAGGMTEAVGMDFKTTIAILGALAEKQERGARAGTRLEMSIAHLLDPSKKAFKVFKDLKIVYGDVFTADKKLRFVNLLRLFEERKAQPEQMVRVFGRRGAKIMIKLLGQTERIKKLMRDMDISEGASLVMAATMQQGITKAAAEASSAWINMKIEIGNALAFITIPLLKLIKAFADWVKDNPAVARFIGVFMGIAAVLLTIVTIVGVLLASVGSLSLLFGYMGITAAMAGATGAAGFWALAVAVGSALWPILLVVGAIGLVIGAVAFAITEWEAFKDILKKVMVVAGLLAIIFLSPLMAVIAVVVALVAYWEEIWGWIKKIGGFLGFGDSDISLSSTATDPGSLGHQGRGETIIRADGSIVIRDETGRAEHIPGGGGTIPINIQQQDTFMYGGDIRG